MKLYLLERIDPFSAGHDEAYGFVIAAKSPVSARKIAQVNGGDEITRWDEEKMCYVSHDTWTDPEKSSCRVIADECVFENECLVIRDFLAG